MVQKQDLFVNFCAWFLQYCETDNHSLILQNPNNRFILFGLPVVLALSPLFFNCFEGLGDLGLTVLQQQQYILFAL